MKKRLLALVCSVMVLGSSMTAFAAPSPQTQALIAANTDLEIEIVAADVKVTSSVVVKTESGEEKEVVVEAPIEVKAAPAQLTVNLAEAVQELISQQVEAAAKVAAATKTAQANVDTDVSVVSVIVSAAKDTTIKKANDGSMVVTKKVGNKVVEVKPVATKTLQGFDTFKAGEDYTVKFDVDGVKNSQFIKVFAYNKLTGNWEQINAVTVNGGIYALVNDAYTAYYFLDTKKEVPVEKRFNASSTKAEVEEYLLVEGGKTADTAFVISTDALVAPFTGDTTNMMIFVFAALAFAGIFAVSSKKVFA